MKFIVGSFLGVVLFASLSGILRGQETVHSKLNEDVVNEFETLVNYAKRLDPNLKQEDSRVLNARIKSNFVNAIDPYGYFLTAQEALPQTSNLESELVLLTRLVAQRQKEVFEKASLLKSDKIGLKIAYSNLLVDRSNGRCKSCLLYTSPSPRDATLYRMPSSA